MKCPLFLLLEQSVQLGVETEVGECIQSECAWYLVSESACSIAIAGYYLAHLGKESYK